MDFCFVGGGADGEGPEWAHAHIMKQRVRKWDYGLVSGEYNTV